MSITPLPPLPKEFVCINGLSAYYTADQTQAYAHQARADLEHNNRVLMDALWKACGDDEDVVNAYIESQGELK